MTCVYSPIVFSPMQKKHAHYSLVREIKRLRKENSDLRNSVSLLKSDLHDAAQSRQETDVAYKKIYDEISKKNDLLEEALITKNEEIDELKRKLQNSPSSDYAFYDADDFTKHSTNLFEDGETCIGDTNNNEFSEDEDEQEPFESFIPSYLHHAILSKLTCARVRLELDDHIMKYDASQTALFSVLASTFMNWLMTKLDQGNQDVSKLFMTTVQTDIAGFWQGIFSHFVHDAQEQYTLLKDIESVIKSNVQQKQSEKWIAQHFHHLVMMLYKHHIINDEATVMWWQDPFDNDLSRNMRDMTMQFVNWIQDSEEEEDSEEEYDDDDDDDIHIHFEHEYIHFEDIDLPEVEDAATTDLDHSGDDTDDAMLENHSLHHLLSNLLLNSEYCICQFTTVESNAAPPFENKVLTECSCKFMSQPTAIEKKEKSVRIAM